MSVDGLGREQYLCPKRDNECPPCEHKDPHPHTSGCPGSSCFMNKERGKSYTDAVCQKISEPLLVMLRLTGKM